MATWSLSLAIRAGVNARRRRRGELEQRYVGGGEMGKQPLDVELRVTCAARNVCQRWHLARYGVGELIVGRPAAHSVAAVSKRSRVIAVAVQKVP